VDLLDHFCFQKAGLRLELKLAKVLFDKKDFQTLEKVRLILVGNLPSLNSSNDPDL
jgi:hypothetical protein